MLVRIKRYSLVKNMVFCLFSIPCSWNLLPEKVFYVHLLDWDPFILRTTLAKKKVGGYFFFDFSYKLKNIFSFWKNMQWFHCRKWQSYKSYYVYWRNINVNMTDSGWPNEYDQKFWTWPKNSRRRTEFSSLRPPPYTTW